MFVCINYVVSKTIRSATGQQPPRKQKIASTRLMKMNDAMYPPELLHSILCRGARDVFLVLMFERGRNEKHKFERGIR